MRITHIVDGFIRSEYFANWQAEHIESGSYSRDPNRRDRFARCYDAAESGADGSTHREHIEDMRQAFRDYLRDRRSHEYPYRVETAVLAHFDTLETWHETNGSIDQQVG